MQLKYFLIRDSSITPTLVLNKTALLLRADINESIYICAGARLKIPTGIALDLPEEYQAEITSDYILASQSGVIVLNSPAIIYAGCKKELSVLLINHSDRLFKLDPGTPIGLLSVRTALALIPVCAGELKQP